ncbi:hypothetical protein BUZ14_10175 [Staphylococcus gallinarum]|uniref:DeoR-like transcriptional repressor C-terminal sensor domain-containing protein n=1 Tax=Staphylococcus gallinarum TaxID=1293 RepID=A0A3A0W0T8_STAGA|nr:hypothetical protein [Staphylococcus gallinarum]RIP33468.1 hypothetical protein BUZ14_10175 [Staphylococcus gallinarum]
MSALKSYLEELVECINKNDIIAFDNHPVSFKIIDQLYSLNKKISVISYSTDIIKYVSKYTNFNIILPNGTVNSAFHIISGAEVIDSYSKYKINYFFLRVPYVYKENLYQDIPEIAEIQRVLKRNSERSFIINRPQFLENTPGHRYIKIGQF